MQSVPVAEAAGEIHFRTILLWHSQGRRKGDPKHKCCGKNDTGAATPKNETRKRKRSNGTPIMSRAISVDGVLQRSDHREE